MQTLAATEFLDHESGEVSQLVNASVPATRATKREIATRLYYRIRDGIRYEVYGTDLSRDGLRASQILRTGSGMCLHKSVVYAAALRAVGIPSRLVLANRGNGPEQVMQMAEERAPGGFAHVHDVLSAQELEDVAANYKRLAGFDPEALKNRPSLTPT